MSRHLSNALFLVFLLFFVLLSPWTRADVHSLGILISASALMCLLSFWYGYDFWRQRWSSFLSLLRQPSASLWLSLLPFLFVLPAIGYAGFRPAMSDVAQSFSLVAPLRLSGLPTLPTLLALAFSSEVFFRGYVQPALSLLLPSFSTSAWLKPLLAALLVSCLAALLFLPSGNLFLVLCIFLLHLPFALLSAFLPSLLLTPFVLSHTLSVFLFFFL